MTENRVGHVDHGKTTLTAAITSTGFDPRKAVGNSILSPEKQELVREAARENGLDPDRLYFIGEALVYDSHGEDEPYNRAEREAHVTGGRLEAPTSRPRRQTLECAGPKGRAKVTWTDDGDAIISRLKPSGAWKKVATRPAGENDDAIEAALEAICGPDFLEDDA